MVGEREALGNTPGLLEAGAVSPPASNNTKEASI